jgi:opacity protein-like surface antigen
MNKSKAIFIGLALMLAVSVVSPSAAQNTTVSGSATPAGDYPYMIKNGVIAPANAPAFQTSTAPRPDANHANYVAVWGGGNLLQQADPRDKLNDGLNDYEKLSLKDKVGFAIGAKIGHTWQIDGVTVYNKPGQFFFSLEGEFIYSDISNSRLKYHEAGYVDYYQQNFDLTIYAATVNPIMRAKFGIFSPYVGVGVGGAYVTGKNKGIDWVVPGAGSDRVWPSGGSESEVVFAFQGIAGTDIAIAKEWSLFVEYKYLGLVGLEFDKAVDGLATYDMGDVYGNHLVVAGIKFHY